MGVQEQESLRAVILTRVSTEGQKDNESHEYQQKACESFCKEFGYEVVAIFNETESGAKYQARAQTQLVLSMLEQGQADLLVMYDMTRFGRNVRIAKEMQERIKNCGARLQFAKNRLTYRKSRRPGGGWELEDNDEFRNDIDAVFASREWREIRKRLLAGKMGKVEKGYQPQRCPPYGWHIVTKKDVIRGEYEQGTEGMYFPKPEVMAKIRTMIFEPYSRSASLNEIVVSLIRAGVPTQRGGTWTARGVRDILKNPTHKGQPAYGRTASETLDEKTASGRKKVVTERLERDQWIMLDSPRLREHFASPQVKPHLVPVEVWEKCQERLASNQKTKSGRPDRVYPLSHLLACPLCGRSMSGRTVSTGKGCKKPMRYYICSSRLARKKEQGRCPCPDFNAEQLENLVIGGLEQFLSLDWMQEDAVEQAAEMESAQGPPARADEIKRELARLDDGERAAAELKFEARLNGHATKPFDDIIQRITETRTRLLHEAATLEPPKPKVSPSEVIQRLGLSRVIVEPLRNPDVTDANKNKVIAAIVDKVRVIADLTKSDPRRRLEGVFLHMEGFEVDADTMGDLTVGVFREFDTVGDEHIAVRFL